MVYDKNGKVIKSDYDYWHLKPQQAKFNWAYNDWFSHFQMNLDKVPQYLEGIKWCDANKGTSEYEQLCKEYNCYPVGDREKASFYNALKEVGAINDQEQPINNSRQITSSNDESVSDEWKEIYHTLTEFWRKMGGVMYNCVDDVNAKRFAQDCYDGIETWIQNCKRKGHIEINDGKFVHSSKEITSNKELADKDMADQLAGFIENNEQLYNQMIIPVIKNLSRKVQKGIFDKEKSLILWQNVADEGAKMYVQEQGGPSYNVATRKETAKMLSEYYDEEIMGDNPIE